MRLLHRSAATLTILMGLLNGWRAVAQLSQREVLAQYGATLPLGVLAVVSALWSVGMLWSGFTAWRSPHKVRLLIPLLFLTYTLYNLWLPTDTLPYLYGHVFLIIFTAVSSFTITTDSERVSAEISKPKTDVTHS